MKRGGARLRGDDAARSGEGWQRRLWDNARAEQGYFGRFAAVGVINFVVDYGLFWTLFYGAGMSLVAANSLSVLAAATNSYLLNKVWTFNDASCGRASLRRYARFLVFTGLSLMLANLAIWLLAWLLPVPAAKLGSIGVTMLFNYWTSRRFVFRAAA
jgi:putative flippase GtrA